MDEVFSMRSSDLLEELWLQENQHNQNAVFCAWVQSAKFHEMMLTRGLRRHKNGFISGFASNSRP